MFFSLAATIFAASSLGRVSAGIPDKIYGVNLGSWLVLEPWMLPRGMLFMLDDLLYVYRLCYVEWAEMGGEPCIWDKCDTCIGSELYVSSRPTRAMF